MQQSRQTNKKARISAIAAIGAQNRVLGKENKLLWHIKEDWDRLKALSHGHPIIMGRKTFESIGKPLPKRTNIVVTRDKSFSAEGCVVVHSLEDAVRKAREVDQNEIFIFGGAEIYKQALPFTDRLYLTLVESEESGDAFFPAYAEFKTEIERVHHEGNPAYTFLTLER